MAGEPGGRVMAGPDRELSDAEITRLVREITYANQRAFFDVPARHVEGRKFLREQLATGKRILKERDKWALEDLLWAEWMVARITKALDANKRKAPRAKLHVTRHELARLRDMAERIESLIGAAAWDEHKKSRSQHADDAREVWYLARRMSRLAGGGA